MRPAFVDLLDADIAAAARDPASRLSRLSPELVRIVAAFAPSTAARAKALRDAGEAGAIAALIYAGVWWSAEPHEIVRHLWLSGRWHDKGVFARSSSLSGTKLEDEIKRALREEDEETMAFVRAFRAEDDRRARARAPPPR